MASSEPSRKQVEARFLAEWGYLLRAGVDESAVLGHLASEASAPDLRELARRSKEALAKGEPLSAVVEACGAELSFWVQVLVSAPRRSERRGSVGVALRWWEGVQGRGRVALGE